MSKYTLIFDFMACSEAEEPKYRLMIKEDAKANVETTKYFLAVDEVIEFARQLQFTDDGLRKMEATLKSETTFVATGFSLPDEEFRWLLV